MASVRTGKPFRELLAENKTVREHLNEAEIRDALNPEKYLGKTKEIIDKTVKVTINEREQRGLPSVTE
jgi:adenylosuccinate lyase